MLRRLATFKGKKKEKQEKTNGQKVNGLTNGVHETYDAAAAGKASSGPSTHGKASDHTANRAEVESSFTAFANLVHAAQRPLPNQSGDGTYIDEHAEHPSLWADIKSLGFKDAKTLVEVLRDTASGADVDDKTMLMERVIQVSLCINS
jgi:linoleate 10R-lipoxygenase